MTRLPHIERAVQRNCDISDARHAGDYGLCTYLLKMREFYRWQNGLSFAGDLSRDALGAWLVTREKLWDEIETEAFAPLPLSRGDAEPFDADAANRELLPLGYVYSAGLGRFQKPQFFLGKLQRVEEREGLTILVSACEYARELAAPPAMLQGTTVFLRQESVRRYLWEKIEEWRWRKQDNAMARALAGYAFETDTEAALTRMADNEMETMVLHEVGEARAGDLLGEAWREMLESVVRTKAEPIARAVRDLLADCVSTLPQLIARANLPALHFYFATFDAPRRQLFPQALQAYEHFRAQGDLDRLGKTVVEGKDRWLSVARALLAQHASDPAGCGAAIEALSDQT